MLRDTLGHDMLRGMSAIGPSVNTLPNGGGYRLEAAGLSRPRRRYSHNVSRHASGTSSPASHVSCPNGLFFSPGGFFCLTRRRGDAESGTAASLRVVSCCPAASAISQPLVNLNSKEREGEIQ